MLERSNNGDIIEKMGKLKGGYWRRLMGVQRYC